MKLRSLTYFFLFISLVTFILGVWQLYRLNWKNELIENIENSFRNPQLFNQSKEYNELVAVNLDDDYNVINQPIFLESKTQQGKVGFHAILPINHLGKSYSVINLGWLPTKDDSLILSILNRIENYENFRVYTRQFDDSKPYFVPENQIQKNIWFSVIKSDLEDFFNHDFLSKYYFVLFDPRIKSDVTPLAFLRNNHLNYSITWFLLSLSSVIMILIIRRKHHG